MASRVTALANGQAALELGLAGVPVQEMHDVKEVEARLNDLLGAGSRAGAQVVIVDESFKEHFSEWFAGRLAKHSGLPLVIFCPSFSQDDPRTDEYINSIVKPAVGFEIRLD